MGFKLIKPNNNINSEDLQRFRERRWSIKELLVYCTETNCSDLYIKVNEKPYISRFGTLIQLPTEETTNNDWFEFYDEYIKDEFNAHYVREKMYDTAIELLIPEDSKYYNKYPSPFFRYRASFGFSMGRNICTFRMIRPETPNFDNINYPPECVEALKKSLSHKTGVTMWTLATLSGKTTTLVACINTFSQKNGLLDNKVIITLEDPIEYEFMSTDSFKIVQKELGKDFRNYPNGITQALREHPNIVGVGECRDKEVITAAIEAARTGHGVTTSFHASSVSGTVSRILYYLDNDINLSYDLIINLNGIFSQRLLKREDRYEVDVQYILFNDKITKIILDAIDNGKNIQVTVDRLFQDEELLASGDVKDWTYVD